MLRHCLVQVEGNHHDKDQDEYDSQVVYSNQKPAYYLNRQFKIICSELSDRFTSNEYVQTVGNIAS